MASGKQIKKSQSPEILEKKITKWSENDEYWNGFFRNGALSNELQSLLEESSSFATRKAIKSDLSLFFNWLHNKKMELSEISIAEYIAYMSERRAVATIERYISSISKIHELYGSTTNPTKTEIVRSAMAGLRQTKGSLQKKAYALRAESLINILESLSKTEWPSMRNRAILAIGWSAALRTSEICSLNVEDIIKNDEGLIVVIKKSKTDQIGKGYMIGIPNSPICSIIYDWIEKIKKLYGNSNGPLFPKLGYANIDRWFPRTGIRKRITDRGLSKIVKKILEKNNITGSVHSLRRGMLTEAASLGVPERIIQRHSRHRSITVLRGYIELGNIWIENPLLPIFDRLFSSS